mmetsp:Transcript_18813/g.39327  ORF Transcript_18813/g.39327 Transcript_18813/m.39327 type:complete len:209 (-) Transcript_18813:133-759(-)
MAARLTLFVALVAGTSSAFAPLATGRRWAGRTLASSAAPSVSDAPSENPSVVQIDELSYFYGQVKVQIGEGFKPMTEVFNPSWRDDDEDKAPSNLCVVEVPMPLGMIIEETMPGSNDLLNDKIQVGEVKPGSNAEAAGIKKGDVLRAVTAQKLQPPAMGMSEDGVKILKAMYICDGNGFASAMSALATNSAANQGSGRVALVLERRAS